MGSHVKTTKISPSFDLRSKWQLFFNELILVEAQFSSCLRARVSASTRVDFWAMSHRKWGLQSQADTYPNVPEQKYTPYLYTDTHTRSVI